MKPNSVSLDPEMSKELGDCAVGDTKDITLRISVDGMDASGFRGTVESVENYTDAEDPEDAKDKGADDATEGDAPEATPAKPGKKRAPALSDAIASEGY